MAEGRGKKGFWPIMRFVTLLLAAIITVLPLVTAFFGSFKTKLEFADSNPLAPPKSFLYFDNFLFH